MLYLNTGQIHFKFEILYLNNNKKDSKLYYNELLATAANINIVIINVNNKDYLM